MKNIAVLVSGGGTNLQALIDAQNRGEIKNGKISLVVSSNPNAYALERAKNNSIATEVIRRKDYDEFDEYDSAVTELLKSKDVDLVVLAGFMTILGKQFISAFENRIIISIRRLFRHSVARAITDSEFMRRLLTEASR